MSVDVICGQCGHHFIASASRHGRAMRAGANLYCGIACARAARRMHKPDEQKKAEKAEYDRKRRQQHAAELKIKRAESYQRNKDPVREAAARKKRAPQHLEYCCRPEYRKWKAEYDLQRRAKEYGPFADVYLLLLDLDKEIRSQATAYERRVANGYYLRTAQKRRRELWQLKKNSRQAT